MKRYFVLLLFLSFSISILAQNEEKELSSNFDFSVDLVTLHLWRGTVNGDAPCVEPTLTYNFTDNFSLSAWAAISVNHSYDEYDWILSYNKNHFSIILSDFYNPHSGSYGLDDYFNFKKGETKHTIDLEVNGKPFKKLPLFIKVATFIAGDDVDRDLNYLYSTYIETKYRVAVSNTTFNVFLGFTPWSGYYSNQFDWVNSGISIEKNINISHKIMLPMSSTLIYNPKRDIFATSFTISF